MRFAIRLLSPLLVMLCIVTILAHNLRNTANALDFPKKSCKEAPSLKVGLSQVDNSVTVGDSQAYFGSLGYIYMDVCRKGLLSMDIKGIRSDAEFPLLQILMDDKILLSQNVTEEEELSVSIPHSGRIFIFFPKPSYIASVRTAVIRDISLTGCDAIDVELTPENLGSWSPSNNILTLVRNTPAYLAPCVDGKLQFFISGYQAAGTFPIVQITQGGLVTRILTADRAKRITMSIKKAPVAFEMVNPYAKFYGHRQVFIKQLRFR